MDLTHLNLVLSTLAQFHAVSIAWKQSLEDDSILDIYPYLSKPPCPNISVTKRSCLLLSYRKILEKIHNNCLPEKVEKKLVLLQRVSDGLGEPREDEVASVLGSVGLGCISPLHLAFQVSQRLNYGWRQNCQALGHLSSPFITLMFIDPERTLRQGL